MMARLGLLPKALVALAVAQVVSAVIAGPARGLETVAREAVLMDATTGAILLDKNAEASMPPASMSKMMTVYMLLERLKEGSLSLDDTFLVSENAWRLGGARSGGSTMFLKPGQRVTVEDLLTGIIVQSGNDACIVVAEALAGSEEAFAEAMTRRAAEIGMTGSHFRNSTGWPDPEHRMTAKDLAVLADRTIKDFPEFYHLYALRRFEYNGIDQPNRNPLLGRTPGADGLKTGHTQEAGYGLTASVKRGDRRLILVTNGLETKKARRSETQRLLEWGFREFRNYRLVKQGEQITDLPVWLGAKPRVPLIVQDGMLLTLTRKARAGMKATVKYTSPAPAPITAGDRLGTLTFSFPEQEPIELPLVAGDAVDGLGMFSRMISAVRYYLLGDSG